ncbi:MAG: LysM domain-containing protein [Patescibacteria group bacterium]|nr:LysM domain-containing protein [Patescibacteria group bacterium]
MLERKEVKMRNIIKVTSIFVFFLLFASCAGSIHNTKQGDGIVLKQKVWDSICRHKVVQDFLTIREDKNCLKAEIVAGPSGSEKWHAQARGLFLEKEYEVVRWVGRNRFGRVTTDLQDNFKPTLVFKSLWEFDMFLLNPKVWYTAFRIKAQEQQQASKQEKGVLLASLSNKVKLPIIMGIEKKKIKKPKQEKNEFFDFEMATLAIPKFKKEKKIIEKIKPVKIEKPEIETTVKTYKVKRGDSLWKISKTLKTKSLSISSLVSKIIETNQIQNPNLIFPGQVLTIPSLS